MYARNRSVQLDTGVLKGRVKKEEIEMMGGQEEIYANDPGQDYKMASLIPVLNFAQLLLSSRLLPPFLSSPSGSLVRKQTLSFLARCAPRCLSRRINSSKGTLRG